MNNRLKKELNLLTATLYGVGIILGAGIYVLLGEGTGVAGNAIWISFIVASLIAAFTGLSYAELAGMFPKTAAEYVYTKKAFNKNYISFIVQWIMIFTLIVSASTVALGFGGYFSFIFGVEPIFAAIGLLVGLSTINYFGIRESARFNVFATLVELSGLLIVAILGMFFIGRVEINYFYSPAGIGSVLSATALIFFAYIGFEELVNLSEETKEAKKIIPKALILSLVISTILYILVSISSVAILGAEALSESKAPMTEVVASVVPEAGIAMSFIALFATANTVLVILIVASRMFYGLAHNNTFPALFGRVGKRKTPYVAVLFVMLLSLAFMMIGGIKTIALLTDVGIFIVYVFINASLIWLRYKKPDIKRTFRSPINIGKFPVLAMLGIASSAFMLMHFDPVLILYEIVVVLVGFGFYKAFTDSQRIQEREGIYSRLFRKSIFTSRYEDFARTIVKYPESISSAMIKDVKTVNINDTAKKAVLIMKRNSIGSVIVMDDGKPVGIVTEGDMVRLVLNLGKDLKKTLCKSIMSKPLITVERNSGIDEAVGLIVKNKIKRLVITEKGSLKGIITATDILKSGARMDKWSAKKLMKLLTQKK